MNKSFGTYEDAASYARELANLCGKDCGISKGGPLERGKFTAFLLPDKANRYGHELICEVIRPSEPK